MNRFNTRALTEGAIFAAITALIGVIAFYIPLFFFLSMFWAVPVVIIGLRNGLRISITSTIVSAILVSVFTGPAMGLSFFLAFGIPGMAMGLLLNRGYSAAYSVLITGVVFAVCNVSSIILGFLLTGVDVTTGVNSMFNEMKEIYTTQINQVIDMYTKTGVPKEQLENMFPPVDIMMNQMRMIIPSIFIMAGMVSSFISFKSSRLILKRINFQLEDIKSFNYWRLPGNFLTIMLIIIVLTYVTVYFQIGNSDAILLNVLSTFMMIVSLIGLSIASFYLAKKKVPKVFRILILVIGFINFQYILAMLGIFDSAFNIRKLSANSQEK